MKIYKEIHQIELLTHSHMNAWLSFAVRVNEQPSLKAIGSDDDPNRITKPNLKYKHKTHKEKKKSNLLLADNSAAAEINWQKTAHALCTPTK